MPIKYKAERVHGGRYDVYITDQNGEFPQRVGRITGGRNCWLAESGYETLGYHETVKAAAKAIADHRAVKTADNKTVTIQEQ